MELISFLSIVTQTCIMINKSNTISNFSYLDKQKTNFSFYEPSSKIDGGW